MTLAANETEKLTKAGFARRIGVTRQRVSNMVKAGLPVCTGGMIDVAAGLAWMKANVLPRNGSPHSQGQGVFSAVDLTEARRLKILADTELTRLTVEKERGDLVSREQTRRAVAAFSRLIRDKWVDFGNRYGQQIAAAVGADPKLVMAELDKAVRLQLDEIANVQAPVPSAVRKA